MFICICRLITRTQIEALVASGVRTVEQVGASCSAGTECGKCRRNIERIVDLNTRAVESAPADARPG